MTNPENPLLQQWDETEKLLRRLAELMTPNFTTEVEEFLRVGEYGLALEVIADQVKIRDKYSGSGHV